MDAATYPSRTLYLVEERQRRHLNVSAFYIVRTQLMRGENGFVKLKILIGMVGGSFLERPRSV